MISGEGFGEGDGFEFEERVVGRIDGSSLIEGSVCLQVFSLSAVDESFQNMSLNVVVAVLDGFVSLLYVFGKSGSHQMEAGETAAELLECFTIVSQTIES